ncbi:P-loop containing nucleoside triphosphate hydrolase protein [Chlamydoabsidia padenii]|nr:P-loop containing nucleoside triphosphate hydrolase protein [Chlamydoabsidia padenii]
MTQKGGNGDDTATGDWVENALVFTVSIYMVSLACISSYHRLPNRWGGILNTHLCLLSTLVLCCTMLRFCINVIWTDTFVNWEMGWRTVCPWLLILLLDLDLIIVTATIPYDRNYLDDKGRDTRRYSKAVLTPTYSCSIVSSGLFNYMNPFIDWAYQYYKRGETLPDTKLPGLPPRINSMTALQNMDRIREHTDWSLSYRLYVTNGALCLSQVFWSLLSAGTLYIPPLLMEQLLLVLEELTKMDKKKEPDRYAQLYTQAVFWILSQAIITIVHEIIKGQLYFSSHTLQMAVRSMLNVEIFRKTLLRPDHVISTDSATSELDNESEQEESRETVSTTGNIINLVSTDAKSFSQFLVTSHETWNIGIELVIGLWILYGLLGNSSLVGVVIMVLSIPVTHVAAKKLSKAYDDIMVARDRRGSVTHEVLRGIRQIKFFAWESQWRARLVQLRNQEIDYLYVIYCCELAIMTLLQSLPLLVIIASFWSYTILEEKELTPAVAFTSMYIFSQLRFQLTNLPEHIIELLQALVSLRRIETYLNEDDLTQVQQTVETADYSDISFTNASITWMRPSIDTTSSAEDSDEPTFTTFSLNNINATFPPNELSVICGKTGSGKTLMMLALIGEVPCVAGSVHFPRASHESILNDLANGMATGMVSDAETDDKWLLNNNVAYVAQTPWLQNASIRDNILFGLPYIKDRYNRTLLACCLVPDLTILSDGDLTEIGERGITLSGGQKARVALARAVYSRAKIVLMDDVLSACLIGPLMQNRTRILITHHVQLCLQKCVYLVHLQNGQIDISGAPATLSQEGLLSTLVNEQSIGDNEQDVEDDTKVNQETTKGLLHDDNNQPQVLVEEEFRAQGRIERQLYLQYLGMVGGKFFWVVLVGFILGAQAFNMLATWWIKQWSSTYEKLSQTDSGVMVINNRLDSDYYSTLTDNNNNNRMPPQQVEYYLGIYIVISLVCILFNTARYAMSYIGGMRASRKIYVALLDRILQAPLRFFDTTPVGRILNRFAGDLEHIDINLPIENMEFARGWVALAGILVSIVIVAPWFIAPALLVGYGTVHYALKFVAASRDCKRIESVSKSPLFSQFTETVAGIASLRAFGATRSFLQVMLWNSDDLIRPCFVSALINQWISIRFAYLSALLILFSGFMVLYYLDLQADASLAGFIFSYALTFSEESFWAAYQYRRIEMSYSSVERVVEYMHIDQESTTATAHPSPEWPSKGVVEVQDLEARYAPDLDLVLKGVTFSIGSGEKIGIVGKTGCGKSTLTMALLRIVEASKGKISIDGIDINTLALNDLRSRLTIIPQDAILFSGTLRSNIDPFGEFDDTAIQDALHRVHLIQPPSDTSSGSGSGSGNRNIFEDLTSPITEGGHNLSIGQRQLVCLARALLKQSKLVIMDEATSSVDFETDRAIQQTMATEFASCTILCVAHRLHTVIEYDRILVMHDGRVQEFDSPLALISNPRSYFYKLCVDSGEFDELMDMAQKSSKTSLISL